MPLIINGKSISELNGPVSFVYLKPKKIRGVDCPHIILLGDIHTVKGYMPCRTQTCVELYPDFVNELNDYAKEIRTDFYVEKFMNDSPKNKGYDTLQTQLSDFLIKYRGNAGFREANTDEEYNNLIQTYEKQHKKMPLRIEGRSNLTELAGAYVGCFDRHVCGLNNIYWQYGDPRQSAKYSKYSKYGIEHISHISDLYMKDVIVNKADYSIEDLKYALDESYSPIAIQVLEDIKTLAINPYVVLDRIFMRNVFSKQYDKLPNKAKTIFSKESFAHLMDIYAGYFTKYDKTDMIQLVELMIQYYTASHSSAASYKKDVSNEILEQIHSFEVPAELAKQYSYIPIGITDICLDIYFILRIHKMEKVAGNKKKLVIGYFGDNHVQNITKYLTEIVKTHEVGYKYVVDTSAKNYLRKIIIEPVINLDHFDFTQLSPTHSSKTRSAKTRSAKTRRSKTRSSKTKP